jgi:hypothetical protein
MSQARICDRCHDKIDRKDTYYIANLRAVSDDEDFYDGNEYDEYYNPEEQQLDHSGNRLNVDLCMKCTKELDEKLHAFIGEHAGKLFHHTIGLFEAPKRNTPRTPRRPRRRNGARVVMPED